MSYGIGHLEAQALLKLGPCLAIISMIIELTTGRAKAVFGGVAEKCLTRMLLFLSFRKSAPSFVSGYQEGCIDDRTGCHDESVVEMQGLKSVQYELRAFGSAKNKSFCSSM